MEQLLFSANIVLPMAILLAMGSIFRRSGLFTPDFVRIGNRLCFYVFLSSSLFKNLYDSSLSGFPLRLMAFTAVGILAEFVLSLLIAKSVSERKNQEGVIVQGSVRSNFAYVGIPLAAMMFSEADLIGKVRSEISLLSILVIPMFNILAVWALTSLNDHEKDSSIFVLTLRNLMRNPCILSILAGLCVQGIRLAVPSCAYLIRDRLSFLYQTVSYLAQMSTPFALIMVGAGLDFSHSRGDKRRILPAVLCRNLIFPCLIFLAAALLGGFERTDYAILVSVFASPTAVASAVMAAEMKADADLAKEIVVFSTLFSAVSLTLIIYLLLVTRCL